jgi:hypothetical protein
MVLQASRSQYRFVKVQLWTIVTARVGWLLSTMARVAVLASISGSRAFQAMMTMQKIDVAKIEAARRG